MNNRQSGRRRGRGGQRQQGGQGRPDQGNRIDNRARGNAAQLLEKYKTLARDAQTQGDRVMTEYYLQFADHYFRVLSESRARFEENQPRRMRDDVDDTFDNDDADDNDRVEEEERAPRRERFERRPREQVEARTEDAEPEAAAAEAPVAEAPREERRARGGLKPRRNGAMNGHAGEADAGESIDADRLPPSFGAREEAASDTPEEAKAEEPAPKPRRGRPRKTPAPEASTEG